MNKIILDISNRYSINPRALKRFVKKEGLKPKQASRLQVLEVVYLNAPDLFYCRADKLADTVEYLDLNLVKNLLKEHKELSSNYFVKGGAL